MAQSVLTDEEYERFRRLIDDKSGLDFPPSRRSQLEREIQRAVEGAALTDSSALFARLSEERGHKELESLVASLTIGETHFFRNRPQFEALENHILPELLRLRSQERRLRIWSAGCSSGEEPYSLAMLLHHLVPDLDEWNVLILATDIDRGALTKASTGIYGPWSFREVPARFRSRYFAGDGRETEVVPHIREMVTFDYLNLVEERYPSLLTNTTAMDLVLCRNVFIYFRHEVARTIAARLHDAMRDDAALLVGHAEPSQLFGRFSVQNFPGAVAYRKTKATERRRTPERRHSGDRRAQPDRRRGTDRRQSPARPHVGDRRRNADRRTGSDRRRGTDRRQTVELQGVDECDDAVRLWEAGRVGEALAILEKAASDYPANPRAPYLVAKIHGGRFHLDAAKKWVTVALERDPLFAPAHHLSGLISDEEGRLEDAVRSLRRCIYADPKWALGHFALAGSLLRLGEHGRAAAALHNVELLLEGQPPDDAVPEGDGLTVARLQELAGIHREIHGLEASRVERR